MASPENIKILELIIKNDCAKNITILLNTNGTLYTGSSAVLVVLEISSTARYIDAISTDLSLNHVKCQHVVHFYRIRCSLFPLISPYHARKPLFFEGGRTRQILPPGHSNCHTGEGK